ncbi:polyserase-2 [Culex quinquefasciatus]|uniref:polyserase-2 n=1 Tax=Culex quinquefasciatus TaxID=7176 RepID=UPI0018E2A331|nr:polyserase-2 [Culex quinquefasciatus]
MIPASILLSLLISAVQPSSSVPPPQRCGVRQIQHQPLIRNGRPTVPGEWPWHAGIFHRSGRFWNYACGGTLISDEFVLTAAHCLYDQETLAELTKRRLRVRLGLHNLDKFNSDTVREYAVEELHFGAAFERSCMKNDIVLVELKERVRFTEYIFPACVGGPVLSAGDVGVAIGWGVTESDVVSPVLRKAELPVIDSDDCRDSDPEFFGAMLHKGMFCAGHRNGTSVCNGDSGGGLFFRRDNVWFVGGLVSFSKVRSDGSNLCVAEGYAGFTDVAWYANWIHNVTGITSDTVVKERQVTLPSKPARISERKCQKYQMNRQNTHKWATTKLRQRDHHCLATLVTEKYLLTTDMCVYLEDMEQDPASATISFTWDPLFIDRSNLTAFDRKGANSVKWIDISGYNYTHILKDHVTCLWTDPEPITPDVIADVYSPDVAERYWSTGGQNIQLWDTGAGIVVVNDTTTCESRLMGAELRVKRVGEDFYRLVGPMIACEPSRYLRLTAYLDQLEGSLWAEEDDG